MGSSYQLFQQAHQVVTALLLAVLEVVPPVVLTKQFQLPPVATSLLFGLTSLTPGIDSETLLKWLDMAVYVAFGAAF